MFKFATLDPRNIPTATEANSAVFAGGAVYGIEVTVPALASRCVGNLDPQHSGGNADLSAIEVACSAELPADMITLATVRADCDSIGAMAVFSMRARGESLESAMKRIAMVAVADKFARGGWPGVQALPTRENPWNEGIAGAESSRPLAAINAAVSDFKVALTDRVGAMEKWLLTGEDPKQYRDSVEKERLDMLIALETGQIKHETRESGRIAVVVSTHRAATNIGYSLAPVVVALNPQFRVQGGDPHPKFSVCQFTAGYVDLKAALAEMQVLEPGWGGSPTFIGSPQGVASTLTTEQVVEVVAKHLRK